MWSQEPQVQRLRLVRGAGARAFLATVLAIGLVPAFGGCPRQWGALLFAEDRGAGAVRSVQELVRDLLAAEASDVESTLEKLERTGEGVVDALLAARRYDLDERSRERLILAFGRLGARDERSARAVVVLYADAVLRERVEPTALAALSRLGEGGEAALSAWVKHPGTPRRYVEAAVRLELEMFAMRPGALHVLLAVLRRFDKVASGLVIDSLRAQPAHVARAVGPLAKNSSKGELVDLGYDLGRLGTWMGSEILDRLVNGDPSENERVVCFVALEKCGDDAAGRYLLKAAENEASGWFVRTYALRGAAKLLRDVSAGDEVGRVLVRAANDKERFVREEAVTLIGESDVEWNGAADAVARSSSDPEEAVRRAAIRAIFPTRFRSVEWMPILLRALGDIDEEVRANAAEKLLAIQSHCGKSVVVLGELLLGPSEVGQIRANTVVEELSREGIACALLALGESEPGDAESVELARIRFIEALAAQSLIANRKAVSAFLERRQGGGRARIRDAASRVLSRIQLLGPR